MWREPSRSTSAPGRPLLSVTASPSVAPSTRRCVTAAPGSRPCAQDRGEHWDVDEFAAPDRHDRLDGGVVDYANCAAVQLVERDDAEPAKSLVAIDERAVGHEREHQCGRCVIQRRVDVPPEYRGAWAGKR